jgi:RimJ/RimL family protein N-acetyltransferase
MKAFPILKTERLLLRDFRLTDAKEVQRLAGATEVAKGTFVPHPYEDGIAESWIERQKKEFEEGSITNFAIVLAAADTLIGSIGLILAEQHQWGQLGYWIGVPYWNQGYCTEAVLAVMDYGFNELGLNRIWAPHFKSNPASGRVLQKAGMQYEGSQREHYKRFGRYEDAELYGLLKREYAGYKFT